MKDYFGKSANLLRDKKLWLFDMDGTIYKEETLFEGTLELLKIITELGGKYVFITNNSSRSLTDYIKKVRRLGIRADKDSFFTSVQASILFIKKKFPGRKIYCQGTKSLIDELKESGLDVTEEVDDTARLILVGFDTELTSHKLRKTCEMLQKNIPFIATNPDMACPVNFGFIPDCGSICQMLMNATGREPIYIGKPEPLMVRTAMEKFGFTQSETVVVGDRLYTDIAVGLNAGVTAVCVLTGEATVSSIEDGNIKPTFTFKSIEDIRKVVASKITAGGIFY